jgi:predicted RNA binding protein YcfA (HicA-like mRNA interferase family)
MTTRDFEKLLKANGFQILRQSKHLLYSDGVTRITLPRRMGSWRLAKMIQLQIRKAVEQREALKTIDRDRLAQVLR